MDFKNLVTSFAAKYSLPGGLTVLALISGFSIFNNSFLSFLTLLVFK